MPVGGMPVGGMPVGGMPVGVIPEGGMSNNMTGEYTYLIVRDTSVEINNRGTPGADLCEVSVDCPMDQLILLDATLNMGASELCTGQNRSNCLCTQDINETCDTGINRIDEDLVSDGIDQCGDNYMSLGLAGQLVLSYNAPLIGCTIQVIESSGLDNEGYSVTVCTDNTLVNCMEPQSGMTSTMPLDEGILSTFTF
jgi:hypothetical protein